MRDDTVDVHLADPVANVGVCQTTAAVFAFVVAMAIFLWISDKTLEWVLYDLILGWKKT